MKERLTPREEDFLYPGAGCIFNLAPHPVSIEKPKGPDVGPAVVEAVRAGDVAERSAHLKPEVVEMAKDDLWKIHASVISAPRASSAWPRPSGPRIIHGTITIAPST